MQLQLSTSTNTRILSHSRPQQPIIFMPTIFRSLLACVVTLSVVTAEAAGYSGGLHHYLYVTEPGVRDLQEYGGHGVIVFDVDNGHKFVKRIATAGVNAQGKPINVKGVCASIPLQRLFIS